MSLSNDFVEQLKIDKGDGWARVVVKWADLKRELAAVPPDQPWAVEATQQKVYVAIQQECSVAGFHGVMPSGINADSDEYIRLLAEDANDEPA